MAVRRIESWPGFDAFARDLNTIVDDIAGYAHRYTDSMKQWVDQERGIRVERDLVRPEARTNRNLRAEERFYSRQHGFHDVYNRSYAGVRDTMTGEFSRTDTAPSNWGISQSWLNPARRGNARSVCTSIEAEGDRFPTTRALEDCERAYTRYHKERAVYDAVWVGLRVAQGYGWPRPELRYRPRGGDNSSGIRRWQARYHGGNVQFRERHGSYPANGSSGWGNGNIVGFVRAMCIAVYYHEPGRNPQRYRGKAALKPPYVQFPRFGRTNPGWDQSWSEGYVNMWDAGGCVEVYQSLRFAFWQWCGTLASRLEPNSSKRQEVRARLYASQAVLASWYYAADKRVDSGMRTNTGPGRGRFTIPPGWKLGLNPPRNGAPSPLDSAFLPPRRGKHWYSLINKWTKTPGWRP